MSNIDTDEDHQRLYDEHALVQAKAAGLLVGELELVLCGLSPTAIIPPLPGEPFQGYADRAVSEMLVLYITRWPGSS